MGQRARIPVDSVFLYARGRGEPRGTATATATSFCPQRAAKDREELQLQHLFPRRAAKDREELQLQHLLSTKGREGPRRAAKGREELQRQHLLSTKGREGARRTATATPFVHGGHGGPRRTATATASSFFHEGPRRAAKDREELQLQLPFILGGHGGGRGTSWLLLGRWGALWVVGGRGEETRAGGVRPGFGGGRCGGAAPAQGRAEGPTARNCSCRWLVVSG